ncbi:unnamed protein product, partial [Owenia fusiformis]
IFHQDNAPSHRSQMVQDTIQKTLEMEVQGQSAYSPDKATCDFGVFSCLKNDLRGKIHAHIHELQNAVQRSLTKNFPDGFHRIYQKWIERHQLCVKAKGN